MKNKLLLGLLLISPAVLFVSVIFVDYSYATVQGDGAGGCLCSETTCNDVCIGGYVTVCHPRVGCESICRLYHEICTTTCVACPPEGEDPPPDPSPEPEPEPEPDPDPTITASLGVNPTEGRIQLTTFTLTVENIGGTATGDITYSNPQCGDGGTRVPDSFTGDTDSTFQCTYATSGPKTASMTVTREGASATPSVTFPVRPQLTVNKGPITAITGTGTVTSSPAGINCGTECPSSSSLFNHNQSVELTATHGTGIFVEWVGGGCSGTNTTCTVTMDRDREVTARFRRPVLTVARVGTGTGVVTISGNIQCSAAQCVHRFDRTTSVNLTATPDPGSFFERWESGGLFAVPVGECATSTAPSCNNIPMNVTHRVARPRFTSLISSITAPSWVRQETPFDITVNTARTSTCTLNPGNRTIGPGTSFIFDGLTQTAPVIYTIQCTHTHGGVTTTDTETARVNVLPRFGEF